MQWYYFLKSKEDFIRWRFNREFYFFLKKGL